MIHKVHHLGIAVPSLLGARAVYEDLLGLAAESTDEVESQRVRVAFYPVGDVRLELLEPTSPDGPVATFLEARGPGLHHVAFEVADIRAELARLRAAGARLIDEEPRTGAHGNLVAFVHPKSSQGVLIELVQPAGVHP